MTHTLVQTPQAWVINLPWCWGFVWSKQNRGVSHLVSITASKLSKWLTGEECHHKEHSKWMMSGPIKIYWATCETNLIKTSCGRVRNITGKELIGRELTMSIRIQSAMSPDPTKFRVEEVEDNNIFKGGHEKELYGEHERDSNRNNLSKEHFAGNGSKSA